MTKTQTDLLLKHSMFKIAVVKEAYGFALEFQAACNELFVKLEFTYHGFYGRHYTYAKKPVAIFTTQNKLSEFEYQGRPSTNNAAIKITAATICRFIPLPAIL